MHPHPDYDNLLLFDLFSKENEIHHFSTTRSGGVSEGAFSSFNMGNYSDDSPLNITENREILARMLYMEMRHFVIPHQTHSTKVLIIDRDFFARNRGSVIETLYGVDATITAEKDTFLCATTADCVPVILYDKKKHVVAAIHAGWRGTVGRIVAKTIAEMERQYNCSPADMMAGIGPAIDVLHYEVGDEIVSQFKEEGFDLSDNDLFTQNKLSGKFHLNLKEINRKELLRLRLPAQAIEVSNLCTYERDDLFFSARRQSIHSGRMLTGIMMKS